MTKFNNRACIDEYPRKVICAFYASTTYGSEYRAGLEFIQFAAFHGFDLAIVADLEQNSSNEALEASAPGMRFVRIPSPIKRQATLYRYTDFVAQWVWHLRVSRWIRAQYGSVESLWVQNGASPWLPLVPYFGLSEVLIWGPVGGGEPPSPAMMDKLPWRVRTRERLRSLLEQRMLGAKLIAIQNVQTPRLITMARTADAQRQVAHGLGRPVPVIPEILDPLGAVHVTREPGSSPRLVWVGQDIPRKNLWLALELFQRLRKGAFPEATLDVFGCSAPRGSSVEGARFHGWVPSVPWNQFQDDGVLLLTSFREGLPSAVLEALSNGLLCVTSDVGAIASLSVPTIHPLSRSEYPDYSDASLHGVEQRIRQHLGQRETRFEAVSNRRRLQEHLCAEGAIT
jgi:glycosyltransferase involved in cell wall biosynthesis